MQEQKHWPISISKLPEKWKGQLLMLGEQLHKEMQSFIKATQDSGGVVFNTQIAMATARRVIMSDNANLLAENSEYINITNLRIEPSDYCKAT